MAVFYGQNAQNAKKLKKFKENASRLLKNFKICGIIERKNYKHRKLSEV
jgi:hypothetical protein